MADIRLRIEVNPNAETETLGDIINESAELSNVSFKTDSDGKYTDYSNTNKDGREMLSWANNGVLKFNSEGLLSTDGVVAGALASETDPDMFVWGAVPQNKQYSVKLTFSNATSLKDIVVYGDKTANQFPTKAIVDGTKTIYSDDYQWAINMETESDTHTIEFVEWNRANYNACLTRIMVMLRYFDLDKGWIDSVESLTQSTSDPSSIQYGVLANSGSATIRDLNGELEDYIKDGIISESNIDVQLLVNGKKVQQHLTTSTSYDVNDKTLRMEFSNDIEKIAKGLFHGLSLNTNETTLYVLLGKVLEAINITIADMEFENTAFERLNTIKTKYSYLTNSSCKEALDKICQLGQLLIYKTDENKWRIEDARPRYSKAETILKIPPYLMTETPDSELLRKNKYSKTEIEYASVTYNYHDLANMSFVNYETPSFSRLKDTNTGAIYNQITDTDVVSFVDRHNANSGISYIAWDIPYETLYASYSNLRWACFKFSIEKKNQIVPIVGKSFVFSISGDSIQGLSVNNVRYTIKDTGTLSNLPITIMEDETAVKNHWFNLDVGGNIISVKQDNYNDGCVVESESNYTFYILTTIMSIYNNTVDYLPYYNGQITIQMKELISETTTATQGEGDKFVSLTMNETFNNYTTCGDDDLAKAISDNILEDYKDGLKTCIVNIMPQDIFDTNGNKALKWSNGEIIKVGDLVRLDKDSNGHSLYTYLDETPIIFRVTGRKLNYSGSPTMSLELRETIPAEEYSLTFSSSDELGVSITNRNTGKEIKSGDFVARGTEIAISLSKANTVLSVSAVKINGIECQTSEDQYFAQITENSTITVEYKAVERRVAQFNPLEESEIIYNVNNDELVLFNGYMVSVWCLAGTRDFDYVGSNLIRFTIESSSGYTPSSLSATINSSILTVVDRQGDIYYVGITYNVKTIKII